MFLLVGVPACWSATLSVRFCFGALLMESEQRRLIKDETALLKGPEVAAGNHGLEIGLSTSVRRVAAIQLAQTNEMKLTDSPGAQGVSLMRLAMLQLHASGVHGVGRGHHHPFTHVQGKMRLHHMLHTQRNCIFWRMS